MMAVRAARLRGVAQKLLHIALSKQFPTEPSPPSWMSPPVLDEGFSASLAIRSSVPEPHMKACLPLPSVNHHLVVFGRADVELQLPGYRRL